MKTKSERWDAIMSLRKRDSIVNKAFALYAAEELEDQADILMCIVLEQQEKIKALEATQANLMTDRYSKGQQHVR